jgi:hypothetical protein
MVKHISSAEEFAAVKAAGKPVRRTLRATARDDDLTDDDERNLHSIRRR